MATSRAGARPADRPPSSNLRAFVLHAYDWSESSLVVELFTRAQGRVVVVAKGAKKPTSNFRAVLLPFAPLTVSLGRTPADAASEIHTLRSAEWAGGAALLRGDGLLAAFYCNELLLKLLARHDPHPLLFDAYGDTLAALAADGAGAGSPQAVVLRAFELLLLRALGWLPDLASATLTGAALDAGGRYTLRAEAGLVEHAQGVPGAAWTALEAALGAAPAHGPHALRAACAPVAAALRLPLRELLDEQLGNARLRTRHVWQGVQRLARGTAG
jgi:DNA repair protein RecO (recombination protein O)